MTVAYRGVNAKTLGVTKTGRRTSQEVGRCKATSGTAASLKEKSTLDTVREFVVICRYAGDKFTRVGPSSARSGRSGAQSLVVIALQINAADKYSLQRFAIRSGYA